MFVKVSYCLEDEVVVLFDSCFTFESKRWHRLFFTMESTRGMRTLVVVFELLEEMVAFGYAEMVSLTNIFKFCRLNL